MTGKTKQNKIRMSKSAAVLLLICWLVYACSYIGKLGYSANIVNIEKDFNVTHAMAGMASTFFFFAYGAGQIINGIFCKKYNLKYLVFCVLLISAACNLSVGIIRNFIVIRVLWLINGAALSVLWPSLIRLLSETLKADYSPKVVVVMGTTVAAGTFAVYGLSALFVAIGNYRIIFYLASVILPAIALFWICFYDKLTKACVAEKSDESIVSATSEEKRNSKQKMSKVMFTSIVSLGFFAIITNLVKDGLTTWVPAILKEQYGVPDSIGIILTLVMPMLALFGTSVAVALNKKVRDFVGLCGIAFAVIAFLTFCLTLAGEGVHGVVVTLGCLAGVSLLTSSANNVITSMAPLYLKNELNAGLLAGIMNGLCYVGSTLSAYGLGAFADRFGWDAVFLLLAALSAACVIISVIYLIFRIKSKKNV